MLLCEILNLSKKLNEIVQHFDKYISNYFAVHNEYLTKVHEHCLLTEEFQDLMTTINNVGIYIIQL